MEGTLREDLRHEYPTLARYFSILGIGENDIKGMRVLDVGAGAIRFAQEAAHAFDANIYSCEPDLEEARMRYSRLVYAESMGGLWQKFNLSWTLALSRAHEGRAEALPYDDHLFDLVVSCYALPAILKDEAAMQKGLMELWRVTALSGRIIMAPVVFPRTRAGEHARILRGVMRFLASLPFTAEWRVEEYLDTDPIAGKQIKLIRLLVRKL